MYQTHITWFHYEYMRRLQLPRYVSWPVVSDLQHGNTVDFSQVKVDELNDSRQIAICIYNVLVLVVLEQAVVHSMRDGEPSDMFLFTSVFLFVSTLLTELLVFVPKVGGVPGFAGV